MARKANGEKAKASDSARWGCRMWVNRLRCMCGAICVRCILLYVAQTAQLSVFGAERRHCCLRAAPLLQGLAVKSGHKHISPPSFRLPLLLPLSFWLLAPSSFISLLLQPTSLHFLLPHIVFYFLLLLSLCSWAQTLSSLIAFYPPLSIHLSALCFSLYAHICDQIMRHIMGLVSLMPCIKVGKLRDG